MPAWIALSARSFAESAAGHGCLDAARQDKRHELVSSVLPWVGYFTFCLVCRLSVDGTKAHRCVKHKQVAAFTGPLLGADHLHDPHKDGEDEDTSMITTAAKKNYLLFLRVCRDMFLMLTLASTVMFVPYWGWGPLLPVVCGPSSLTELDLDATGWIFLAIASWIFGLIALYCMEKFQVQLQFADTRDSDLVEKTLWLTELPRIDSQTGEPFWLDAEEFEQVERDLRTELDRTITSADNKQVFHKKAATQFGRRAPRTSTYNPKAAKQLPKQEKLHDRASGASAWQEIQVAVSRCNSWDEVKNWSSTPAVDKASPQQLEPYTSNEIRATRNTAEVPTVPEGRSCVSSTSKIERVHVAPVVDTWHHLEVQLRRAQERFHTYNSIMVEVGEGLLAIIPRCRSFYYKLRRDSYLKRVEELQKKIEKVKRQLAMSGSAFVTFKRQERRDLMLTQRPGFWTSRDYTLWNFGKKPFASVTLRCRRAVHPDDVYWENLHITAWQRGIRSWASASVLFISMAVLVTPVAMGKVVEHIDAVSPWLESFVNPSLIIYLINSLALPAIIERIANFIRFPRHSAAQAFQMRLNFWFLMINTFVLPSVGLTSSYSLFVFLGAKLRDLIQGSFAGFNDQWEAMLHELSDDFKVSEGNRVSFFTNYLLTTALVTNANHLHGLLFVALRMLARVNAVTPEERKEAESRMEFAWGFWYAWAMSIVVIGIMLSTSIPVVLPCAFLFFLVMSFTDELNLNCQKFYQLGPDSGALFAARALHSVRCTIAAWWLVMSLVILYNVNQETTWDSFLPVTWVVYASYVQFAAGVLLWVWSEVNTTMLLHEVNFQLPGAERNRWWTCCQCVMQVLPKLYRLLFPALLGEARDRTPNPGGDTHGGGGTEGDLLERCRSNPLQRRQSDTPFLPRPMTHTRSDDFSHSGTSGLRRRSSLREDAPPTTWDARQYVGRAMAKQGRVASSDAGSCEDESSA